ncbi:ComF family protein [Dyadobacter chenwenxiniae]|uniref:ComF family protein n=1 Tax=Dyadobacter chenwenxiniae TaxID=2906456 RepID=A0A9X1PQB2_9BACT|nr:phosphoribosyltransferase family protein [Dyadobacter chenwenxiniae]MCF0065475.1 ComF family protein [Dyadobacter chenwenxiniae]UON82117.1 ComF family protein [Dyadobacter chenwenxiniae]
MNLKNFLSDFSDLIFPRCCEACDCSLVGNEATICTSCMISLPRIQFNGLHQDVIRYKFVNVPEVALTHSFLLFTKKGKVQRLLHALKYKGNKDVGLLLGFMFGQEMIAAGMLPEAGLIISVPLHAKKKKLRSYNQSDLLAEGFSNATGIPWSATTLERIKHTATQTGKSKIERRENVKGVFAVNEHIKHKSVIIMDDVLTTGATLEECVQTLKLAGCESFTILTIALAEH